VFAPRLEKRLEEDLLHGAHGGLDVQSLDVLPVLLEQRHQKVDGQGDVLAEVLLAEADVADGGVQAQHLLHLELDGVQELVHLRLDGLTLGHGDGHLVGTVEAGADDTGDLLGQLLGSQEHIELLGQGALDQLLVLVQLLEVILGHSGNAVALHGSELAGLLNVLLVSEHADVQLRAAGVAQLNGSVETLILGGIVVLQACTKTSVKA